MHDSAAAARVAVDTRRHAARAAWRRSPSRPGTVYCRLCRSPLRVEGRRRAARGGRAACPTCDALIIGGHEQEPDLARLRALAARLGIEGRVTFRGLLPPSAVARRARAGGRPGAPQPGIGNLHARDLAAQAVRIHGGRQGRSSPRTCRRIREVLTDERRRRCSSRLAIRRRSPPASGGLAGDPDAPCAGSPMRRSTAVAEYSWDRRAERLEALFTEVLASSR